MNTYKYRLRHTRPPINPISHVPKHTMTYNLQNQAQNFGPTADIPVST